MPKHSRRRVRPCRAMMIADAPRRIAIIADGIMSKWAEHQSVTRESGCFIRFIDEDKYNCAVWCTPYDAFTRPDWKVDWDLHLTACEVDIVRLNMHRFARLYKRN